MLRVTAGHGVGFYEKSRVELSCINLGESASLEDEKVFQKPALAALTCPVHS